MACDLYQIQGPGEILSTAGAAQASEWVPLTEGTLGGSPGASADDLIGEPLGRFTWHRGVSPGPAGGAC